MPKNTFFAAYTKRQLRYLIAQPEIDLTLLEAPLPAPVKPFSAKQLRNNVLLMIKNKEIKMTKAQFLDPRYSRSPLPACICLAILTKLIGE